MCVAHIDRIVAPNALPNDEDVLRTRNRTTGTVELEFSVHRIFYIAFSDYLYDVGLV